MVNGGGGELGPDLSRIGSGRPRAALTKKIRTPSDSIRPGYEPVTLVLPLGGTRPIWLSRVHRPIRAFTA